jgi:hypothetical protein
MPSASKQARSLSRISAVTSGGTPVQFFDAPAQRRAMQIRHAAGMSARAKLSRLAP